MRKRLGIYSSLLLFLLLLFSFVRPYRVSDISMNYSLMDGDIVWVENWSAGFHVPSFFFYVDRHLWSREEGMRRGAIYAFRHPLDRRLYLKRCVALPGDRLFQKNKDLYLQLAGDSNRTHAFAEKSGAQAVRIRGEWWLRNPYRRFYAVVQDPSVVGPKELINYPLTTLPPHRYFFMGDYRDNSTDSRFFGPVPYDYIYYRVVSIWKKSRTMEELGSISHFDDIQPLVIRKNINYY